MYKTVAFQRLEAAAILAMATFVYFHSGLSLLYFVLLLFIFDIFMIGYAVNARVGALTYNIGHSFIIPALVAGIYALTGNHLLLGLSCLWFAHIGLDRALGYGLKFDTGFTHTHLGEIGKK